MKSGIVLAVLATLIVPAAAFSAPSLAPADEVLGMEQPTKETVLIQLNLTGVATKTNGGPDSGFTAYVNVTGLGTRQTPNGNGVQIRATDLLADIIVVSNEDGVEVENYTALVGFHAQQASCAATGEEEGCFKFGLQLRGQRGEKIVSNNANPEGRVLAMNAKGDTTGTPDDEGVFAMDGSGQSTTQPDGKGAGATHYNLDLMGTGSIRSHEAGEAVPAPKAWAPVPTGAPSEAKPVVDAVEELLGTL